LIGIAICDLSNVRSIDLTRYSGVITIEEPDTDDPFRTDAVPQLVLQFHDVDMTMLGYVEPEPEHVQQALTFARETDGPLLVHCRAGISRSPAIALAIASDRFGSGNEQQAYHCLLEVCPHAQPNRLAVHWIDQVLSADHALSNSIFGVEG
jgi:predicted protein tyrosine phosphatase